MIISHIRKLDCNYNTTTTILMLLLFAFSLNSYSQAYTTAVGVRALGDFGISIQQKVYKKFTIECILETNTEQYTALSLLGEFHHPILIRRLNFYTGIGPHIAWEPLYDNAFGISAVAGIEVSLKHLNLSWDFKPSIHLIGGNQTFVTNTAISFRYIVIKQKRRKNRKKRKGKLFNL